MNFNLFRRLTNAAVVAALVLFTATTTSAQTCECKELGIGYFEAENLAFDQPDKAKQLIKKAEKSKNALCQSMGLLMDIRMRLNDNVLNGLDEKLTRLKAAASKTDCKDSILLDAYLYEGELYYYHDNLGESFKAMNSYIEVAKRLKDYKGQMTANRNMAMLLDRMGQTKQGIKYTDAAYSILMQHKDHFRSGDPTFIASNYLWYYQDYDSTRFRERCSALLELDEEWCTREKDYSNLAHLLQKKAALSAKDSDFTSALKYTNQALNYLHLSDEAFKQRMYFPSLHRDYASYSFQTGKYAQARMHMDSCYAYLGKDTTNAELSNFYELSYKIAKATGNFKEALEFHEKLKAFENRIKNEEQLNLINEYEQKYQKAENELKITQLNADKIELRQQKQIDTLRIRSLIGVIAAVLLGLLILIYFFRLSRKKAQMKIIQTEQRLNRARMDPHFFFNALSSIQTLALKEQQPKIASLLTKFSRIMRQSLENTYVDMVTIEQEQDFLEHYLALQKLRHPGKFDYEIEISDALEPSEEHVPGMLIQPFVENAIEHGFSDLESGGMLYIVFEAIDAEQLKISITDNGLFFSNETKHKEFPSRATQIVKDRLFLLKKQTRKHAAFTVQQDLDLGGYRVEILLPRT